MERISTNVLGPALLLLTFSPSTHAQTSEPAVWYRSSEGCPDGEAFIGLLARRSLAAQLAQVGDRIDFVVTLGPAPGGARGRLERQTSQGTVALREVTGPTCDAVADAVALTLALTWEPSAEALPKAENDAAASPDPERSTPATRQPSPSPPLASRNAIARLEPSSRDSVSALRFGALATVSSLTQAVPLVGGDVFGELRSRQLESGLHPALRLGVGFAYTPNVGEHIHSWILATHLAGCPVLLGNPRLQLRPCTGVALGAVHANAAADAGQGGVWLAWTSHLQLSWEASASWGLEALAGLQVPLTRYELTVGQPERTVAKTRTLGFLAGLGAHWGRP